MNCSLQFSFCWGFAPVFIICAFMCISSGSLGSSSCENVRLSTYISDIVRILTQTVAARPVQRPSMNLCHRPSYTNVFATFSDCGGFSLFHAVLSATFMSCLCDGKVLGRPKIALIESSLCAATNSQHIFQCQRKECSRSFETDACAKKCCLTLTVRCTTMSQYVRYNI